MHYIATFNGVVLKNYLFFRLPLRITSGQDKTFMCHKKFGKKMIHPEIENTLSLTIPIKKNNYKLN